MQLAFEIGLVVTSLILVVLVLFHRGRGGGLSSMFGGSMTSQLSGSSVVEKNLNYLTMTCAILWVGCTVVLGLLYAQQ